MSNRNRSSRGRERESRDKRNPRQQENKDADQYWQPTSKKQNPLRINQE